MRTVVFFNQRQGQVHSGGHAGRRVNILVANEDGVRINVRARGALDQSVTPVPVGGGAAAIEQAGSSKQHCAGADRSDPTYSAGNLFQPTDDVRINFILFNRIAAGDEQSVDLAAQLPKSVVRGDADT